MIYVDSDITALLVGWPHVPIHCDFGLLSHCLFLWFSFTCIVLFVFFFNDTATTEIYTLSLHDALPICWSNIVLFGSVFTGFD